MLTQPPSLLRIVSATGSHRLLVASCAKTVFIPGKPPGRGQTISLVELGRASQQALAQRQDGRRSRSGNLATSSSLRSTLSTTASRPSMRSAYLEGYVSRRSKSADKYLDCVAVPRRSRVLIELEAKTRRVGVSSTQTAAQQWPMTSIGPQFTADLAGMQAVGRPRTDPLS